jgi:hypothetical protein
MEEIKLYEGKETLFFDPIPHQYFWNDELLPSATTITKLLTPAAAIGNWTAKMCADEFKKLIKAGVSYDEIELIKYYDQIKKSANANMSSAGLVGGEVHNLIETYIHTGKVVEVQFGLMGSCADELVIGGPQLAYWGFCLYSDDQRPRVNLLRLQVEALVDKYYSNPHLVQPSLVMDREELEKFKRNPTETPNPKDRRIRSRQMYDDKDIDDY